ncbi:MAG: diacylglycerol kinase family protein [Ginsengibacter sp.]
MCFIFLNKEIFLTLYAEFIFSIPHYKDRMATPSSLNILFILNPVSGGKKKINWEPVIRDYFSQLPHKINFFILTGKEKDSDSIQSIIKKLEAHRVVAVGGDGTISLVGKLLLNTGIPLGILRGGSANGMAEELKIPANTTAALDIIVSGRIKSSDAIRINDSDICFHLSDIGLNAQLIKYFDESRFRGMWNYARMMVKVLINGRLLRLHLKADNLDTTISAYMVVIANASKYGSGAVINPDTSISDGKFELVVVRKISLSEFIKLFWSYQSFNPSKVEIFQTTKAQIISRRKTSFQIDGEYKGKITKVDAEIFPSAINFLVK